MQISCFLSAPFVFSDQSKPLRKVNTERVGHPFTFLGPTSTTLSRTLSYAIYWGLLSTALAVGRDFDARLAAGVSVTFLSNPSSGLLIAHA
jgi:hypothetical protein